MMRNRLCALWLFLAVVLPVLLIGAGSGGADDQDNRGRSGC
jgi:hypothetical protein